MYDFVTAAIVLLAFVLFIRWFRSTTERQVFERAQLITIRSYMEAHQRFLESNGERMLTLEYRIRRLELRIRALDGDSPCEAPGYDTDAAAEQV